MSSESIFFYVNCLADLREYEYNSTHGLPTDFDKDTTSILECTNLLVLSFLAFLNLIVLLWLLYKFKKGRKFTEKIKNIKFWVYFITICLDICKLKFY